MKAMYFEPVHPGFQLPQYKSAGAAAFDLLMPEIVVLGAYKECRVGLGFKAAVPEGYMAVMAPRSGTSGITLVNTIGFIDSDYRGEWKARLFYDPAHDELVGELDSEAVFYAAAGDRLLQVAIVPVQQVTLLQLKPGFSLPETGRGAGGFGSTGR